MKIEKSVTILPIAANFGMSTHIGPLHLYRPLKFELLKTEVSGRPPSSISNNRDIAALLSITSARPHCVRWRPSILQKGGTPPILVHVSCGETAACIKMTLGTEVGLGPIHILLDGDPASPTERDAAAPPHFSAHVYCGQTVAHISSS